MRTKRLALLATAALVFVAAWRFGLLSLLRDPAHARQLLLDAGPLGFVVFILTFGFIQPIAPIPGMMFIIAASLVWPPPVAIALSLVGSTLAAVNGFWFARYLARDWVEQWIPPRLKKYDAELEARGFLTVLLLRLFFWTNQGANAFFGLSRVRASTHLVATVIAFVPVIIALTYLGDAVVTVLLHQPLEVWLAATAVCVVAIVVYVVIRTRRKKLAAGRTAEAEGQPAAD